VSLTAHHTGGHTKGGTTWSMHVAEGGKTYFVVFPDGTSVNPGYRLARHPSYPGIADDYRRSFHVHEMLRPDIWLHAHTNFFDFEKKREQAAKEGVQAWIDPEGYRRWVVSRRNTFEQAIENEMTAVGISGPTWQLIQFTDKEGETIAAEDRSKYTAAFRDDGRATVRIDCNRGGGSWKLGGWNGIELGPLALTRAACPSPLTDRFARDWQSLKRFQIKEGRLFLSLPENAGTYEFEPMPDENP
jgi:heat shock protein HslJ